MSFNPITFTGSRWVACGLAVVAPLLWLASTPAQTLSTLSDAPEQSNYRQFEASIAPVLVARCLSCHGTEKSEGGYSIATLRDLLRSGDSEATPVVAGNLQQSELWRRLTTADKSERMPVDGPPLNTEQLSAIRRWIESGAPLDTRNLAKPIVHVAAPESPRAPRHYPRALPIYAIVQGGNAADFFIGGYAEITRWNANEGTCLERIPVAGTHVMAIAISPDKQWLAVASGTPGRRGQVEIVSLASDKSQRIALDPGSDIAADLAFSPDGHKLAIAEHDGRLTMVAFDPNSQRIETQISKTPHADTVLAVAWSTDGNRIATASRDRTAKLYDGRSAEPIVSFDRHERAVGGVGVWENRLLSLDETGRLRVMAGEEDDRVAAELAGLPRNLQHFSVAGSVAYFFDRHQVRAVKIEIRTVEDGKDKDDKPKRKDVIKLEEQPPLQTTLGTVLVSLATDGQTIAAGSQSGEVWVWNSSGQLLGHFLAKP